MPPPRARGPRAIIFGAEPRSSPVMTCASRRWLVAVVCAQGCSGGLSFTPPAIRVSHSVRWPSHPCPQVGGSTSLARRACGLYRGSALTRSVTEGATEGAAYYNTQDGLSAAKVEANVSSEVSPPASFTSLLVNAPAGEENAAQALFRMMTSARAQKLGVWLAFLALAYQLKSFYGIILGTFVLSYIGSSVVQWSMDNGNMILERLKMPRLPRRMWAFGYISCVILCIGTLTVLTVPRVVGETKYLSLVIESENPYVFVADGIRKFLGPEATEKLEQFLLTVAGDQGKSFATGIMAEQAAEKVVKSPAGAARAMGKAAEGLGELSGNVWTQARSSRFAKLMEVSLKGYIKSGFYLCRRLLQQSTSLVYKGILSLLFSFMIVWDLPKLAAGARRLKQSRLKFPYEVLAPKMATFGKLVGQSFEVQSLIAVVNTILTTLGLILLKVPGYGFMSLLVLVTSFIPVFGVFISTLPMALVALTEYGVKKMLDVIVMIILIHVVEAYMLSPIIYSATVKLHPVLILSSLYISEHVAGLQGVFLAVPVTMYIIKQLIFDETLTRRRGGSSEETTDDAAGQEQGWMDGQPT